MRYLPLLGTAAEGGVMLYWLLLMFFGWLQRWFLLPDPDDDLFT